MSYTELSALGEFGLIDHLTRDIRLKNASTRKGVGDDAAVLDYEGKRVLVSTDMLIEGVHFDLAYTPLKHLGYKAVAVNASDIYAMNGTPRQITLSLALSNHASIEGMEEFYAGVYLACERYGIDLVGVTRPLPERECASASRCWERRRKRRLFTGTRRRPTS